MRVSPAARRRLACLALGAVALVGACAAGWRGYRHVAGDPSDHLAERWHEGHRVLDRRGRLLRELPSESGLRGRELPLDEIGTRAVMATLVSEDKSFYEHDGVDAKAIARAMSQNARHARIVSGASTITEQLVKLLDSAGEPRPRSLVAKLREAARAQNLERVLPKQAILEAYMNRLSYGHGMVGPEAAAQGYFGVRARDVSWGQAAFLAVLPRAPSYLDPYVHLERVRLRQVALLDALLEEGVLGPDEAARAKAEPIALKPLAHPFLAPHLVEALRIQGALGSEGGETRTTIDLDLQRDAEGLVRTHLAAVAEAGARDAALLIVDNRTGEILTYVGSADFHDPAIDGQIDMVRAPRQPGSTLKPFVYALGFAHGHRPSDMLADVPTSFAEQGRGSYAPGNFDGGFEGPISAREALAGSLNVPAVRLAQELGAGELLTTLRTLGMASLTESAEHYGLSLALGSGEVMLGELATGYVAMARGGEGIQLRILDGAPAPKAVRVIDQPIAASIAEVLSDPLARVRGLHGQGPFDIGFPVAVKTGTSSGFRDTWTVGFTHERTVAVWVGNADGSPMRSLTGSSGAGPLFADVMRRAMRDVAGRAPLWAEGDLVTADVCPLSGKRAGPACSDHATRRFPRGHAPDETCDAHVKASPRVAPPGEPPWRCDPRGAKSIVVLPDAFDGWLSTQTLGAPGHDPFGVPWYARSRVPGCEAAPPSSGLAGAVPAGAEALAVLSPASGSVFVLDPMSPAADQAIEVTFSWRGGEPASVDVVLDGRVVQRSAPPYHARIAATAGDHEIVVRPTDPTRPVLAGASRFSVR